MNDLKIFQHIRALVDEEHQLRAKAEAGEAAARPRWSRCHSLYAVTVSAADRGTQSIWYQ
jgi:hypothetical protein